MAIRFQCACGANLRVPTSALGKRVRCQSCGTVTRVEMPETPPEDGPIPLEPAREGKNRGPEPSAGAEPGVWLEDFAREEAKPSAGGPTILDLADPGPPEPPPIHRPSTPESAARPPDAERDWISAPEKPFWRDLGESFIFFMDAGNFVAYVGIVFILFLPRALPIPFVGFVLSLIAGAYAWAFFLSITRETASGEDELPTVWIGSMWDDVVRPLLLFLGTLLAVLWPALVLLIVSWSSGPAVPWGWVLGLVFGGMFLWPAVMLAVSIGGSFRGLWPHVVIQTILAAPGAYLAICAAVVAAEAVTYIPALPMFQQWAAGAPLQARWALDFIDVALSTYTMIVTMRVIGLYYRHFKHKFPWTGE